MYADYMLHRGGNSPMFLAGGSPSVLFTTIFPELAKCLAGT